MDSGHEAELLASELYDEGVISEVIRPAAIVPEASARAILVELALQAVGMGGVWESDPTTWKRYDRPFDGALADRTHTAGSAQLIGTIQVAYGTPSRYEITIYRVTVTRHGSLSGFTVDSLCEEALRMGGLTLGACPRASLAPPPKPLRLR
jgi:hypothetical protein